MSRKSAQWLGAGITATSVTALALYLNVLTPTTPMTAEPENKSIPSTENLETATLGGGCFWCTEAAFELLDGVVTAVSGFAGGSDPNPTYHDVCRGITGHAEVTQLKYDPKLVSFEEILNLFWKAHDPTTLNRQGADVGTHYRSIILYHNEEQRKIAENSKNKEAEKFDDAIVTEIVPFVQFFPAEDYHQDYFKKNPDAAYCSVVIRPKIKKLKKLTEKKASN